MFFMMGITEGRKNLDYNHVSRRIHVRFAASSPNR